MDTRIALKQYRQHRKDAATRNVPFLLSFEEWCDIWLNSGFYHLRGRGPGLYCMSRYGDQGPYQVGNVFIQSFSQNSSDANKGRIRDDQYRQNMSKAKKGSVPWNAGKTWSNPKRQGVPQPKVQCPHCLRWGGSAFKYYNFDRCPLNAQHQA